MTTEQVSSTLADAFYEQYVQRRDLFAVQLRNGAYVCIKSYLQPKFVASHLAGKVTLGGYLLDGSSQARQLILDADQAADFEQLKALSVELSAQGAPSYLETSRRGGHLRLFFAQSVSGRTARQFGRFLLKEYLRNPSIELYPKQVELGDGPGSLVRLPFGVHHRSGLRYNFIHPDGSPLGSWQEQIQVLSHPERVPYAFVYDHLLWEESPGPIPVPVTGKASEAPWDRIKAAVSVVDFVSRYVTLKRVGRAYLGRCPFHDDQHPSFGVNVRDNYWNCFAGCGGGSVIDFWMLYRGVNFVTAVMELEAMLVGGKNG